MILLALCFVAVVAIALASYIAVCTRAMTLSNRSFQGNLSKQLAELGIEEALRAFNKNNWSDWTASGTSANWALDSANHRATCTITFPSTKFGQGVAGTAKIRVDNYDVANLDSTWSATKNYRINDLVGYNGIWYRCVQNHLNQTPSGMANLAYWVPAPIPWLWQSNQSNPPVVTSYGLYDVVNYNGTWYRCTLAHTSPASWNGVNWSSIGSIKLYSVLDHHTSGDIVYKPDATTWYLCTSSGTPGGFSTTAQISWQWLSATSYAYNDLVCVYHGTTSSYIWYRCILAHSNHLPPNATYWEDALAGSMWAWSSTQNYNIGDVVFRTNSWYRCIQAHINQGPPNSTYWSNSPLLSTAWDPGRQYSVNDTVRYKGVWFRCLATNFFSNPFTSSGNWASAADSSYAWSSNTTYVSGSYANYDGSWYRCDNAPPSRESPNNLNFWTALGAPVVYAEGTVTLGDNTTTKTQLRTALASAPLFPNAIAAKTTISVTGGGTVDSYDGSVNGIATQGSYTTYSYNQTGSPFSAGSPNIGYSAVVAARNTAGASTAISLGGTAVQGYLAAPSSSSSPYAALYSSGGSVKGSSSPASPSIDPNQISRSPYVPQFDTLPSGGLATTTPTNIWNATPKGTALVLSPTTSIGTPGATTPSRYYYNGNLTIGTATIQYLEINGPVILYVNGNLSVTASGSTGRIDINSPGSAEIHVAAGLNVDIGGEGIYNRTFDPKNLIVICDTSSNASQFYSDGSYPFYGVLYIPNTTYSSGFYNDNGTVVIYGAISAMKVSYTVAATLHYDTSLRYATFGGVDQPYAVSEWRELTDASELATMP